jgi:hypothetical protein
MNEPPSNEFAKALAILNRYYRAVVVQLAEDVVQNEEQFESPLLGNAETIIEKYSLPLTTIAQVHEILRAMGEAISREKIVQLGEDEYLCFGCRALLRKEQGACPKCGWSWARGLTR